MNNFGGNREEKVSSKTYKKESKSEEESKGAEYYRKKYLRYKKLALGSSKTVKESSVGSSKGKRYSSVSSLSVLSEFEQA
mmetsp:Transcript_21042/g.29702  ORF Transcript_21042/g.29702 Transcript_21042/m.29702 type:complete len:80 (-) Transcript_21042:193-432(-)